MINSPISDILFKFDMNVTLDGIFYIYLWNLANMDTWLVVITIFLAIFASRSVYRILQPQGADRDAYGHFFFISDIRKNGHRIPLKPSGIVTTGSYRYPFLVHWLLSFLPQRHVHTLDRYFSPLMDVAFGLIFILMVPIEVLTQHEMVICLILLLTTPEFVRPDRSHGMGLSARKPGLILTTLGLFLASTWAVSEQWLTLMVAVSVISLIFLTSKFSVQALLWIGIILAIAIDVSIAGIVFAGFILAISVSGGAYGRMFMGHLRHLKEYAQELQYSHLDSVTTPLQFVHSLADVSSPRELMQVIYQTEWMSAIANNPHVLLVGGTYAAVAFTGSLPPVPESFHYWIFGGLTAFILTSLPHLRFLGQAERYLEYLFFPSAVLISRSGVLFGQWYLVLIGIVAVIGGITILGYVLAFTSRDGRTDDDWHQFIELLKDYDSGVVVVQPSTKGREIAYKTSHAVVDFLLNGGSPGVSEERKRLMPERYTHVTDDVEWLRYQYDPRWVIFDLNGDFNGLHPPTDQPVERVDGYELYSFDTIMASQ
jgi:hypothetical protein